MKNPQVKSDDFIFTTIATDDESSTDEFAVELFEYSPDLTCTGEPKIKIKNFEELIEFFETIE